MTEFDETEDGNEEIEIEAEAETETKDGRAYLYVMARDYKEDRHGSIRPVNRNACWNFLDNYLNHPERSVDPAGPAESELLEDYTKHRDKEQKEIGSIRQWAYPAIDGYDEGKPIPPRQFGVTHTAGTSRRKQREDDTSIAIVLTEVLKAEGTDGITSREVETDRDKRGGGVSGSFSKLHLAGIIHRLEKTR